MMGRVVTGPQADLNLAIHAFVGSTPIEQAVIDTGAPTTTYYIYYVATDENGLTSTSTCTVFVEPIEDAPAPAATSTGPTATSTSTGQ